MNAIRANLQEFIEAQPVINTHSHQDLSLEIGGLDLEKCFRNSYVAWCGVAWEANPASRTALLGKIRFNSYFVWLERALQSLYGFDEPISAQNWERLSDRLRTAHQQSGYWINLLKLRCQYEKIVEDAYWDPGSHNGLPSLFTPAFRVNAFFFGYATTTQDHDGNNALQLYRRGQTVDTLDDYQAFLRAHIVAKQKQGCVALKIPIAYDRGLDFENVPKASAAAAFERLKITVSAADVKTFQDYLAFHVCELASEFGLPIQVHTGMGKLERSNALWLKPLIQKNPETRFVLLHCSSPWIEDTVALLRSYSNLYPDLAWLPQMTSQGAQRMLHELIEAGMAYKTGWGCDTWTPEESYGSLLAFRQVLATALAEKVESGYFSMNSAEEVARRILSENARDIYKLPSADSRRAETADTASEELKP